MQIFQNSVANFFFETLFGELLLTIVGVILAQPLIKKLNDLRYGKWCLTVIKNEEARIEKMPISPGKIKQFREIPEEMPVFLKGMCSPFHRINCDLMQEGKKKGVLNIDEKNRVILINLDRDVCEEYPFNQTGESDQNFESNVL
jgi:hypothetical protein